MSFTPNPDFENEMAAQVNQAAQNAVNAVAADYLGADIETVMAQLKRQFAERGINLTDDEWLRQNLAQPISEGEPVIVVDGPGEEE